MQNFPKISHLVAKLIFDQETSVDIGVVETIGAEIIKKLNLTVVNEFKHEFTQYGLTKVWILSQSHIIFHTWPEDRAIHIDLLTCPGEENMYEKLETFFKTLPLDAYEVKLLSY
jgi:S-adenosylmethionine decarboxylase